MATKTSSKSTSQPARGRVPKKGDSQQQPEKPVSDIATAAYFKAERRGFVPGRELDDWLEAEAEMLTRH